MAFIPDEAIDRFPEIDRGPRLLYVFLARCRNQKTGKCCPSLRTTMQNLNCGRTTVFELRRELQKSGWAIFDGDNVTGLFGFTSPENRTPSAANAVLSGSSPTFRTAAANPDAQSGFSDSAVQVSGLERSSSRTAYKEEPAKEPAKEIIPTADAVQPASPSVPEETETPLLEDLWSLAFRALAGPNQVNSKAAATRSLIGRTVKELGETDARQAMADILAKQPADPVGYLCGILTQAKQEAECLKNPVVAALREWLPSRYALPLAGPQGRHYTRAACDLNVILHTPAPGKDTCAPKAPDVAVSVLQDYFAALDRDKRNVPQLNFLANSFGPWFQAERVRRDAKGRRQ